VRRYYWDELADAVTFGAVGLQRHRDAGAGVKGFAYRRIKNDVRV
jgi:hypothetical protein